MTKSNFKDIQKIAYEVTGISLSDHKENMIYGRLARRLRALKLTNFDQYCALLKIPNSTEIHDFTNSITTNLTSFFRENHHFEFLKSTLIPKLMRDNVRTKRLRIWSAGCSTGEEPYSIAMVISSFSALQSWDIKILASDLDSNVVNTCKQGVYNEERVAGIPDEYQRFLIRDENSGQVQVKDSVRKLIRFNQLNLLHDWPMKGPFDFIFCRNVVIYFDHPTQKKLFDRYADLLRSDGHLFIGHSENLHKVCDRFSALGRTTYQRKI